MLVFVYSSTLQQYQIQKAGISTAIYGVCGEDGLGRSWLLGRKLSEDATAVLLLSCCLDFDLFDPFFPAEFPLHSRSSKSCKNRPREDDIHHHNSSSYYLSTAGVLP